MARLRAAAIGGGAQADAFALGVPRRRRGPGLPAPVGSRVAHVVFPGGRGVSSPPMLTGRTIHLCVAGGIAAYKAVELARALQKAGAEVRVAMTPNAREFVGPLTFQAITRHPVLTRTLDPSEEMQIGHIAFAQECDALVVAPATANVIGKAACGLGDEIVSTVLLAADAPVIVAPAMNTRMFDNPAVQRNLAALRARGWHVVEPDAGQLACGQVGPGRLAEPPVIVEAVARVLARPRPLAGRKVLISAGPTREHFDPVRFLGNPSSGKTGFALAAAAAEAGAEVVLVHGPVSLAAPPGVEAVPVTSAREMHAAIVGRGDLDAIVMSAAVADWRPAEPSPQKRKKAGEAWTPRLVRNPDILAELGAARAQSGGRGPALVGFAAETGDPIESARAKLFAKRVDLVVANDVSAPDAGFAVDTNRVWFVEPERVTPLPMMSKRAVADAIVNWLVTHLGAREGGG